ncbi:hypothetical protein BDN72DRAFT_860922 [Pluteus cervinus]|uniref:Uncharacterized protein n=1 Tax=Pluteus cervinus TaxID=181527 RepID=A0ACD3AI12_9AGAR|nr:hypothetical protein BDN72DRAFT_860922 [Pluteus cervinus]
MPATPTIVTPGHQPTQVASTNSDPKMLTNLRPSSEMLSGMGRCICRGVILFDDISSLFLEADRREASSSNTPLTVEQVRSYKGYVEMLKIVPSIQNLADSLAADQISKGSSEAKRDDIHTMKRFVGEFLNAWMLSAGTGSTTSTYQALNPRERTLRGLRHDLCGCLLCPTIYDWKNLTVRQLVRNNAPNYQASSNFFCRCFYEDYEGNADALETGFLKSPLLVRGFTRLYAGVTNLEQTFGDLRQNLEQTFGDLSELHIPPIHKDSVSAKLNLCRTVTPRTIAYTAVLVHFNLTEAARWEPEFNGFSYPRLFNFIVDFFESPPGRRAQKRLDDLLEWWNNRVFGPVQPSVVDIEQSGIAFERQRAALESEED